jgi:hypothetical protein
MPGANTSGRTAGDDFLAPVDEGPVGLLGRRQALEQSGFQVLGVILSRVFIGEVTLSKCQ